MNTTMARRPFPRIIGCGVSTLALAIGVDGLAPTVVDAQVDEIVVTAQRREQNLQDVPVAVSAVPAERLEAAGVNSTADLSQLVPGLNVTRQLSGFAPILRGVGNYNAAPGSEGAVATYVDGVYMPSAYGSVMALANIDRVEVLRGPQGTLFGRNATGGLIHVITKTPSQETSGTASASYGSQNTVEAKFYGTTGLAENVAVDLGLFYRDQGEGFGTNLVTGSDTIFSNDFVVRSKALISLSDRSELTLSADYADSESDLGLARRPEFGTVTLFGTTAPEDFWNLNQARDHTSFNEQWGVSGRFEQELGIADLTALLAYREVRADISTDQGEGPVDFILGEVDIESDTLTAELQLKSKRGGWFNWIAGFYYFDNTAGVYPFALSGSGFTGSTVGAPDGPFSNLDRTNVQDTNSYSVFGEGVFDLTDRTRFTIGARYTVDERDFTSDTTFTQVDTGALIGTPTVILDEEFKEPSWRVVLDHRFSENILAYGSYGRGFKSGIFNLFSPAGDPVEAETLDAYEVGVKTEIFNDLLRLNSAAFYYRYDDLQLTTQREGQSVLTNAAEAETMGIEFEAIAALGENFEVNANLSVIDTEFKDFPGAELTESNPTLAPCPAGPPFPNPNCVSFGNAAGNELPRAPNVTFSLGGSYERSISVGTFGADVSYYYNDGFFNDFANRFAQDSYTLVNASSYLVFGAQEQYRVSLYGRNIGNTEYYSYGTATVFGDYISPSYGRQYGGTISYNF